MIGAGFGFKKFFRKIAPIAGAVGGFALRGPIGAMAGYGAGKIAGGFLGGGGGGGYQSPYTGEYENTLKSGIYGRMNQTPYTETYKTDYVPKTFSSGYQPSVKYERPTFNFQGLPEQYQQEEYALGSKPILNEGASSLERIKETVGPRRQGLLLKAAEQSERDVGSRLADLQTNLRLAAAKQKVDLGVDQQKSQDEANFRTAGFSEDQARKLADEKYREAEFGEGQARFGAEEGAKEYASRADLENKKVAYNQDTLDYLDRLFGKTSGLAGEAASRDITRRGQTLTSLGSIFGSLGKYGGGFLNKEPVKTKNGYL